MQCDSLMNMNYFLPMSHYSPHRIRLMHETVTEQRNSCGHKSLLHYKNWLLSRSYKTRAGETEKFDLRPIVSNP
jgi:hypothetical protein